MLAFYNELEEPIRVKKTKDTVVQITKQNTKGEETKKIKFTIANIEELKNMKASFLSKVVSNKPEEKVYLKKFDCKEPISNSYHFKSLSTIITSSKNVTHYFLVSINLKNKALVNFVGGRILEYYIFNGELCMLVRTHKGFFLDFFCNDKKCLQTYQFFIEEIEGEAIQEPVLSVTEEYDIKEKYQHFHIYKYRKKQMTKGIVLLKEDYDVFKKNYGNACMKYEVFVVKNTNINYLHKIKKTLLSKGYCAVTVFVTDKGEENLKQVNRLTSFIRKNFRMSFKCIFKDGKTTIEKMSMH